MELVLTLTNPAANRRSASRCASANNNSSDLELKPEKAAAENPGPESSYSISFLGEDIAASWLPLLPPCQALNNFLQPCTRICPSAICDLWILKLCMILKPLV